MVSRSVYYPQTNNCLNKMTVKYDKRNQNKGKLMVFIQIWFIEALSKRLKIGMTLPKVLL